MSGKKYTDASQPKVESRHYELEEAIRVAQEIKFAGFDETMEIALRLGVNPRHADQMVRGTVTLPHGLGRAVKVCVITSGEKIKEAEEAGAEFVGGEDLVKKIQEWMAGLRRCRGQPGYDEGQWDAWARSLGTPRS